MADLLIEIGVEEIPADVVLPALDQMQTVLDEGLSSLRLAHGEVAVYGTPRRLAAIVQGIAERQPDEEREIKGPPASAAFDAEGRPTRAATGFAAGKGVALADLQVRETDKGSFVFAVAREEGRSAAEVIPGLLDEMIGGLNFPKTMKWSDLEARFARPVRWLVALLDQQVLEISFAQVKAGRATRGHRFLGQEVVPVPSPGQYLETLRSQYVIADHRQRRALIAEKARAAAAAVGGCPRLDDDLLDENNFLVEYPTCILGSFSEHYLQLPEQVPVTVMEKHQRYFPVEDAAGRLMPNFIIIRNGDERGAEVVRRGNEKVIVPRLDDAEFYMTEDLKTPLVDRLDSLRRVTYLEGLGSLLDKTRRLEAWVQWLGERLPLSEEERADAARAATLSKCDQVTLMVGDGKLASLQGLIGGHYAALNGEQEGVAQALAEQYLPVRQNDPLPASAAGKVLALADKLDNLCAAFRMGLIPKGTRDPQGLRRQAQGVLSLLLAGDYRLNLAETIACGVALLPEPDPRPKDALEPGAATAAVLEFMSGRVEALLLEEGIAYDVVRAVLAASWTEAVEVVERGRALSNLRETSQDFEAQVDTATRPANIWRGAGLDETAAVAVCLFQDESEKALWTAYVGVKAEVESLQSCPPVSYQTMWDALCRLRQPIEVMFEAVMVNAEDPDLRTNRLAMMRDLDRLYLQLADFTQIVQ